jgi:uncharacterized SAM-binding protein YcdF (DUF218 family)
MYRRGRIKKVLLIADRPRRVVQLGVLPPGHEVAKRELAKRGVPPDAIVLIPEPAWSLWEAAERLDSFLTGQPGSTLLVVTNQFGSGIVRWVLDQRLPTSRAARVSVLPLEDRRYNDSNWWRTRRGLKSFMNTWVYFLYTLVAGPDAYPKADTWDPDEYETWLRQLKNRR